jgi:radical SAM superfamily enzyme YgiQ (UPF0313 family)
MESLQHQTYPDHNEELLRDISLGLKVPDKGKKIALIIPSSPQIPTPGREFLVTGPFEGFTYIATLVKKLGYELKVIDCRLREDIPDFVLKGVSDADAIGIATYCDSFVFLQDTTRLIKEAYPEKLLFLGGPLVTSLPQMILENTSADCAVISEGELTLIELLDRHILKKTLELRDIKGIAWKDNSRVVVNRKRPLVSNLDNLPYLDYTVWPNYESIVKNGQILISSTRGCPQMCSFCFKTIAKFRNKTIKKFDDEVNYLKKTTKFNYTWLNDLTFNSTEKRAIELARVLKRHDVRYHCFARVQKVTRPFVETLRDTGCLGIWFGIESLDQDVLDINRKNQELKEAENAVELANYAGLAARGLFIVGLRGETEESLKKMLDFIRKTEFMPLVKHLVPFPGTELFDYAVKTGKIKDIVGFLKMLSKRKVGDYDDEIINITDLPEETLRHYFHEIWKITKEREDMYSEECA